ncbi:MAG: methanol--corrinoid methyltransferase [Verrucomicrobia bacterium]|jgi:methanol--5-hydroxybenzimidazolylcobamide Co-methyltransferase|nr:methanol--corrinoid methyltransferase [Verrucomicrobiota bacterium]
MHYQTLAISHPLELTYGVAPQPVTTRSGMVIGGGTVYPELNFTLPPMTIDQSTLPEIRRQYEQIIDGALRRAADLEVPGVVIEFETLPPMTEHPQWGLDIARVLLEGMAKETDRSGLKSVLRMTPNDNREFERPPLMRRGRYWDAMLELFDGSAAAGAELLSIESVGGKELHDEALVNGDLAGSIFSLCILGERDMRFLWTTLKGIADRHGVKCAGDTACGFGNTAMVLAEQRMIPRLFAAVVRAVTAVRSLVAYECGAVGPGKDCGYENPILKAITGCPMAMEGKTSACAHLSPMGNLAAACCDTWSNESVQNIKLLGGMAPTCYMEQLAYDCRLMNTARRHGKESAHQLQRWLVESDVATDPQAFIISPESSLALAKAIVGCDSHYHAGVAVARKAIDLMRAAHAQGKLRIAANEVQWFDTLRDTLDELPESESEFIDLQLGVADKTKFLAAEYGLKA